MFESKVNTFGYEEELRYQSLVSLYKTNTDAVFDEETGKVIQKPKEIPKELEEIINKRKKYFGIVN